MKIAKNGTLGLGKNKNFGSARIGGKGRGLGKAGALVTTPAKDSMITRRG